MAKLGNPYTLTCPSEYTNLGVPISRIKYKCSFDGPRTFGRTYGAVNHWIDRYAISASKAPRCYNCKICKLGFTSIVMYAARFQKPYGKHKIHDKCKYSIALMQIGLI
jgi:hypothetical protein